MPETIFVTGGTGMLGANLARVLTAKGHTVRLLTRGRQHPFLESLPIELVPGDLHNHRALVEGMDGCTQVYHSAGLVSYRRSDTRRLYETNALGTKNLLAAALEAGVRRVVHTSSTAAVGYSSRADQILNEDVSFDPRFRSDPYMWSKHLAEEEVAAAVRNGLDVVMVNPSSIYGAGDVNRNSTAVFDSLQRGKMFAAPPGGNSVVSVDDVVSGMLLAMERGARGRRYILTAERLLYSNAFNRIAAVLGGPPVKRTMPRSLGVPLAAIASVASTVVPSLPASSHVIRFSFGYRYFSSARALKELGWEPRVSFEEAISSARAFQSASV